MTLSRSWELNPSSLLVSNNKFICRLELAAGSLRCVIAFLPNDCDIALGVWGAGSAYQQTLQLDERRQLDARRAHGHSGADDWVEHPTGDGNHDTGGPLNLKKLPRRSLFQAPYADLAAKIGMPPVMDFQLLTDMGRMNG